MERYERRRDLQYGSQRFDELIKLGNISKNPTSKLGCTYHVGGYRQRFAQGLMDIV